jgi:hypothetical protein
MAVIVGEAIQDYDASGRAPQDEIFVVILRVFEVMADKAVSAFAEALNVFDSPGRP